MPALKKKAYSEGIKKQFARLFHVKQSCKLLMRSHNNSFFLFKINSLAFQRRFSAQKHRLLALIEKAAKAEAQRTQIFLYPVPDSILNDACRLVSRLSHTVYGFIDSDRSCRIMRIYSTFVSRETKINKKIFPAIKQPI